MSERVLDQLFNYQLHIYNAFKEIFEVKRENLLYKIFNDNDKKIVKSNYTKFSNYYKKIPSLIRKNGLILTLCFLKKKSFDSDIDGKSLDKKLYEFILNKYIGYMTEFDYIDKDINDTTKLFNYLFNESDTSTSKLMNVTIISMKYFDTCSQIINAFDLEALDD